MQFDMQTTLMPAYGRRYKAADQMRADWENGKDFRIGSAGPYTSIRDLKYLRNTSSTVVLMQPEGPGIQRLVEIL